MACSLIACTCSSFPHPLRPIREIVNGALAELSKDVEAMYAPLGRPSISPGKLLRASLLQAFYSIRSERQLMERLEFDLLFRWFVGLGIDDAAWDHPVLSKNRDRLLEGTIVTKFLAAVRQKPLNPTVMTIPWRIPQIRTPSDARESAIGVLCQTRSTNAAHNSLKRSAGDLALLCEDHFGRAATPLSQIR
jgi:Transposase domain (DUF772)